MAITNVEYQPGQQYLFNRSWSIALGAPGETAASVYTNLRIQFDIDKLALGSAAKAKISVYNLSSQSRQKITKGWNVQLKAGYNGLLATIFLGVVGYDGAYSKRDGPDIITTFECGDGEKALAFGTFDKSYPAGTTVAAILQDTVKALQSNGINIGIIAGLPSVTLSKGYTAHGPIADTINYFTKQCGLAWNVNNGSINIIPVKGFDGQTATLVSVNRGLIGVPSMGNQGLKFESLLNPRLIPGSLAQVISENAQVNGIYKINRSHYEGDSHDSKWQVGCEAILFPNATAQIPISQGIDFSTAVIA